MMLLHNFIVTMLVFQAVLLTVCSLYSYSKDVLKHKLDRKFWIYVQENKYNDVIQQEWTSEMKDEELDDFERLVEIEEAKLWD